MKKTITLLFVLISAIAISQNVTIQGPPAQKIYSSYSQPAPNVGNVGDLWSSSSNGIAYWWQKRNANWYRFFQTIDTTTTLATQYYVNSHGFGTGTVTSIATSTGITGGIITTTGTLKADTNLLATQSYVLRNAWGLTGNSGTSPSNNFIGTTDGKQLKIRAGEIGGSYSELIVSRPYGQFNSGLIQSSLQDSISNTLVSSGVATGSTNFCFSYAGNVAGDTFANIYLRKDSGYYKFNIGVVEYYPFTIYPEAIKIDITSKGTGKVLTSDASGLATWGVTAFTQSDSATIYATTPTVGTTYLCTNCSGSGITGRIVSYYGSAWRRIPVSTLIN